MTMTGYAIRARRRALGLSQHDVSRLSGVKQPLLSAIEAGRRQPTEAVAAALRDPLRVRPSIMLASLRPEVTRLVRAHRGREASVFGSVAKGTDSPDSDLDIMVDFAADADITDLLALQADLSELLTIPVDIVSAGSSSRLVVTIREEAMPL